VNWLPKMALVAGALAVNVWGAPPAAKYVTIKKISAISLSAGKQSEARIEVVVDKGMHLQANPAGAPNLIPTKVTIEPKDGLVPGDPVYPAGVPHVIQGIGNVPTYEGTVAIKVPVDLGAEAKPGKVKLAGSIRYQACTDQVCYFPMTIPFEIPVAIKNK
jgi:DsbC/DsbD-like thiol-disulfide interchange protein